MRKLLGTLSYAAYLRVGIGAVVLIAGIAIVVAVLIALASPQTLSSGNLPSWVR